MPFLFVEALVPVKYICESRVRRRRHFPLPPWPRDSVHRES